MLKIVNVVDMTRRGEMIMNKKVTGILSYLSILWLVAWFAGDKKNTKFHLSQGFTMMVLELIAAVVLFVLGFVVGLLGFIPVVSKILGIVLTILSSAVGLCFLVLIVLGIMAVCNDQDKELPVVGKIRLLK